jgi:hypothetical protein
LSDSLKSSKTSCGIKKPGLRIKVDPDEIRIPGQLYDDPLDAAKDMAEENLGGSEEED